MWIPSPGALIIYPNKPLLGHQAPVVCIRPDRLVTRIKATHTHTHISPLANRESEREGETDREKDRRTDREREKELMDRDMAMREKGTRGHTRQAVLRAEEMEIGDDDCYSQEHKKCGFNSRPRS